MIAHDHGRRAESYQPDEMFSVTVPGQWSGTITRRSSSDEFAASDLPKDRWSFAHIHVGNELVLGLRFHEVTVDIIYYVPGRWEGWFGQYDPSDTEIYPPA